ncbi:MAG: DUF5005 domain-containing protein [Chitinophagales bacterium]|nr:DUF5005 domain-containing protein [Chitinophagales bacterium]
MKIKYTLLIVVLNAFVSLQSFGQSSYADTTFTNYFRETHGFIAGDATISIALPNGKSMFLFGDSHINDLDTSNNTIPCLFQVHNCFTILDSADPNHMKTYIDTTKSGVNQTYFKIGTVGNSWFWPDHGFVRGDTVYVFLGKYNSLLAFLGQYIAKVTLHDFTLVSMTRLPDMNGIIFGKAVIYNPDDDKYYLYGNKVNWIVYEPYVARTSFDNLMSGAWEFYTGSDWSSSANAAKKISNQVVSPTFGVVRDKDFYYIITQENGYLTCGLGRNIYAYKSSGPTGPFTNQILLYTIEDQLFGHYMLTYNAFPHPEWTKNNELLISYNLNDKVDTTGTDACPSQCKNVFRDHFDPDTYRPKFIRVPLSLLEENGLITSAFKLIAKAIIPNVLDLTLEPALPQSCRISIFNKMGKVVYESEILQMQAGVNHFQIATNQFPPDIYVVAVNSVFTNNQVPAQWERKTFLKVDN